MLSKVCTCCEKELPLSDFTPHKRYKLGVLSRCRVCCNATRKSRKGCQTTIGYQRKYYQGNRKAILTNPKNKERKSLWAKENRPTMNAHAAKRRARQLNATPPWLSDVDKAHINRTYKLAKLMEEITGDKYHVDHIIPLQGKNVCGLHVPKNLQVLRADLNLSKSNSH